MVVLGDAGAGKTVLAVRFVLDQLRYRATLTDAARADEPVPVRVNAAGWDGSVDFTAWLANQLAIGYALNPRVARAIVDTGRILPVLDGLDEMDPPDAGPVLACAALERLNKPPWQNRAVVVACRTNVYAAIRELRDDAGLQFATTITLQPFSADDIYFHLEQYRDELGVAEAAWAPVTDQLVHTPDGILASALRTPWLLSLAATALHRGRHESAIALAACRDPTEIRDLLFGSLIPAAVEGTPRTGHTRDYSEQNVNKWMQTLAHHLERRSDFSRGTQIALDEVWKLAGTRRCLALHPLVVGLVAGLVGLPVGLMVGVMVVLWPGLAVGLWVVPVSGLLAGLVVGLQCAYAVGLVVGIDELRPGSVAI